MHFSFDLRLMNAFLSEHEAGRRLMNIVIEEGLSWPFEETMEIEAFRAYFLSHAAFVVRVIPVTARASPFEDASGPRRIDTEKARQPANAVMAVTEHLKNDDDDNDDSSVWGAFYIKPNFPGRCSHVCNGGFITDPRRRRRGVARLMGHAFLRFAKELGYKASYFNLVFRTNEASVRLWRGLGFKELAVVPKAGRLKGIEGLVDAIQFHYDLEQLCIKDLPWSLQG